MSNPIATVVLDEGINKPLDYEIPETLDKTIFPGTRVLVPVGKTIRKGTVQGRKATSAFAKLAKIHELLEDRPLLSKELMHLAEWMAKYYATPLRRVMRAFLPASIRDGHKAKEQLIVKRIATPKLILSYIQQWREKHPARTAVLEAMLKKPSGILLTELLEETKTSKSPVETLAKEGLLHVEKIVIDRANHNENEYFRTSKKKLTDEQDHALTKILETMGKTYATHLLYGVTGSGKTEVYLQAIDKARENNQGVIMLVPEIALTTQTTERLRARFGEKIAILHHRLSDGERRDLFHQIQSGEISIVVGARSAIFSPVQNLKLIIIDEEHDASFKQSDEMPCYHAREVAIYRAHLEKATVVLGSATPSLESFYNAEKKKFHLLQLTKRADCANMPKIKLIDLKQEREKGSSLLSEPLLSAIKDRTEKGEQTLLFLNRRGYHAMQLCSACTHVIKCPHCDISLTFHKGKNTLACHLCHYTTRPFSSCPNCKENATLHYKGFGTEQVERVLNAILPDIRTLRMDGDTTRHKGAHDRLFKEFRAGKADVLIGTQMIAKGFHFPAVTLVGVLAIDTALNIPDFRAAETAFQLLIQVSGRAGRAALPGEVYIQTFQPNHPIFTLAKNSDYPTFYKQELQTRKLFNYPPFSTLIQLLFSGPDETATQNAAIAYHQTLASHLGPTYTLYPPAPDTYAKISDRYRFSFLIKGPRPPTFPPASLKNNIRLNIKNL